MKKLLIVLLAVVMVFGFASTAFAADTLATAYPDLSGKDTTVQDAFMKLSALDVFDGYPDGTIKPDANITRAEFAKIACILSGMADSADVLKGNASKFSDVPANQWYTGYVNLATSLQFVSGYPDGTFKPNTYINMQEALTVLLRIAGYNDNLVGPWPMNYIAQGGKLDVTDDVAFAGAAPATRAAIAVMAANVLDIDVVYWDSDKAKFVEDTDSDDNTVTVLEDKLGADVDSHVILWGFGFEDFDDQELFLKFEYGYFENAQETPAADDEMAESYWISNGLNIGILHGLWADLIYNDDDEIVYIDIKSSASFFDDVSVNWDADADDFDSIEVDGKAAKIAGEDDLYYGPPNLITIIDHDQDFEAAKLYYNDDNELYMLENVSTTVPYFEDEYDINASPAVFKSFNEAKKRIEVYSGAFWGNISTDQDLALLKYGQFITPADLKEGDILNEMVPANNCDALFIVTSFAEDELTKASSTKLTIGGTGLVFADTWPADDGSYMSNDGMETDFFTTTLGDLDPAFGATVQYAAKFLNPYDLDLVVFTGEATNTLYGVITDVEANIDGQVSAITVLGKDGEEVEYTLVKGDTNGRPAYHNYLDMYYDDYDDGFDLTFGTYIEAKVAEDGAIDTDDIKALVGPVYYSDAMEENDDWNHAPWHFDLLGYGVEGTDYVWSDPNYEDGSFTINNNRIQIRGVYYTFTDDTLVFQTTTTFDDKDTPDESDDEWYFDEAEVIDVADLMAADEVFGGALAFIEDGVIQELFLLDSDLTSNNIYGVLDDVEYRGGDWYGTLLGGSEYKMDEDRSEIVDNGFFNFIISSGELTPEYPIVWITGNEDDGWRMRWTSAPLENDELVYAFTAGQVATNGDILTLEGDNFTTNDDTVFYKVEDGEITEGDIYDIEDGETPVIVITTDEPDDCILSYVFVLIDASFSV